MGAKYVYQEELTHGVIGTGRNLESFHWSWNPTYSLYLKVRIKGHRFVVDELSSTTCG